MTETCAQLQTRLDGYLTARDKLATGGNRVRIRDGGKDLQYGPGDARRARPSRCLHRQGGIERCTRGKARDYEHEYGATQTGNDSLHGGMDHGEGRRL